VFMDSNREGTPPALLHNLKHNHVLRERVVFLTVQVEQVPRVSEGRRFEVLPLGQGMVRLRVRVGFAEDVNVPALLARFPIEDVCLDPMKSSFFLGREHLIARGSRGMARRREKLFAAMARNARGVTHYFHLPPNRVVELGMQLEI
jgi:KUP system potassium uptake protein